MRGYTPSDSLIRCVKSDYVKNVKGKLIWNSFGDVQDLIWVGVPTDSSTLVTGNFVFNHGNLLGVQIPMIDLKFVKQFNDL